MIANFLSCLAEQPPQQQLRVRNTFLDIVDVGVHTPPSARPSSTPPVMTPEAFALDDGTPVVQCLPQVPGFPSPADSECELERMYDCEWSKGTDHEQSMLLGSEVCGRVFACLEMPLRGTLTSSMQLGETASDVADASAAGQLGHLSAALNISPDLSRPAHGTQVFDIGDDELSSGASDEKGVHFSEWHALPWGESCHGPLALPKCGPNRLKKKERQLQCALRRHAFTTIDVQRKWHLQRSAFSAWKGAAAVLHEAGFSAEHRVEVPGDGSRTASVPEGSCQEGHPLPVRSPQREFQVLAERCRRLCEGAGGKDNVEVDALRSIVAAFALLKHDAGSCSTRYT